MSENAHNLAPSIQHIYTLSLRSGVFPKAFKISKIVPLAKVPQPNSMDYLRPISITPVLSRHFERLIYTKFIKNSYESSLNNNQFGFRTGGSTVNAALRILYTVCDFDTHHYDRVRLSSLDLSKAFDRVPHHFINSQISRQTQESKHV